MADTQLNSADPRVRRHAQTKAKILREAWKIASRDGVSAVSLGELAKKVGLRQPSLYTYFDSKDGLYDEMFADGYRLLIEQVFGAEYPEDPIAALKVFVYRTSSFSATHVAHHSLLFQRPVPDFRPSAGSFALAKAFYERGSELMARAGITRQEDLDMFISIVQGMSDQQVSNQPGGDRWISLTDDAVDSFLEHLRNGGFVRRRRGTK